MNVTLAVLVKDWLKDNPKFPEGSVKIWTWGGIYNNISVLSYDVAITTTDYGNMTKKGKRLCVILHDHVRDLKGNVLAVAGDPSFFDILEKYLMDRL